MIVYFYVGLSGSGKTTLAYSCLNDNEVVIDSDEMRRKLFGDENYQGNNELLFATMLKDTIYWLKKGYNVHYVATNLTIKHRMAFIRNVKEKVPETEFKCVVCVTPVEECKKWNKMRERVVPEFIIDRQLKNFQIPLKGEGWDSISIIKTRDFHGYDFADELRQKIENFGSQHSKYHSLTLKEHSDKVADLLKDDGDEFVLAAKWHDLGKIFTKTEGEDGYWHYIGHENVSAYYALMLELPLESVYIINYHMIMLKNNKRVIKILDAGLWNKIVLFSAADREAH